MPSHTTERSLEHYRLLRFLYEDGPAQYHLAVDMDNGQEALLSIIPAHLLDNPARLASTLGEALLFQSPALLASLEHGITGDRVYVAWPYLPLGTVGGLGQMTGPLPADLVCRIIEQAAEGLEPAHRAGLAHFYLTPRSILRVEGERFAVCGFGLGLPLLESVDLRSRPLPYAAPEVLMRLNCSPSVDIYALGLIAYELLAGQPAIDAAIPALAMEAHLNHTLRPLASLRPDLPPTVEDVLRRATAKAPSLRFHSVKAFAQSLRLAVEGGPAVSAPVEGGAASMRAWAPTPTGIRRFTPARRSEPARGRSENPARLFADALSLESRDPERARALYYRILEVHPQIAQGEIIQRLAHLERSLASVGLEELEHEVIRAREAGDREGLIAQGRRLLDLQPDHPIQEEYAAARRLAAADAQYSAAAAALRVGQISPAMALLGELGRAQPGWDDREHLAVLRPEAVPFLRERVRITAHKAPILGLAFSPDSRLVASGATDRTVRLWHTATGRLQDTIDKHGNWVCQVAFHPSGAQLFAASWDGEIKLWGMPGGSYQGAIAGLASQVSAMVFSRLDPNLMVTTAGYFMTLWRLPQGRRETVLREPDHSPVISLDFAPHAGWLACGLSSGRVRVRDLDHPDYPVLLDINHHRGPVYAVGFNWDGSLLASAGREGLLRIFDAASGRLINQLAGHNSPVVDLAWSPSGALIATAGRDGTVRLWHPTKGEQLAVLEVYTTDVTRVRFSPDGRMLAAAGMGGDIVIWSLV